MDTLLHDLRSGLRILTKSPGPAAAAVLVLALGIGLATAMFSIVNGIVLRGLPFEDGHELMHLEQTVPRGSRGVPLHDYLDWRQQQSSFEDLAGFYTGSVYLSDGETAERFDGAWISANAFAQLRVSAAAGRVFGESHDRPGAEPVIVLGYHLWRDRYGSDPEIVGRTLTVDGKPTTVVGVMPEGFRFPIHEDAWLPLAPDRTAVERNEFFLEVFGRLRDGVSLDAARLEMGLVARRLEQQYPETNEDVGALVKPFTLEFLGEDRRNLGFTSLGAVAFVLLIACSNVANLLLARTTARAKELAVRSALGAGRGRVIAQVLAESFVLSVVAAGVGIVLARWGVDQFNAEVASQNWPFWFDVRVNAAALAFVLGLTVIATLASGLAPALRASRLDVNAVLKDETRGAGLDAGRLSKSLVVVEVALSCVLLVGAGLMVRSIVELAAIDFAFATERVFTARVGLPEATYPEEDEHVRFYQRLHEELRQVPGITSVTLTSAFPGTGSGASWYGSADQTYGDDKDYPWAHLAVFTPDFFATFDVDLLDGRSFDSRDDAAGQPVVIVNRSLAEREWPGESPLGKRLRLGRSASEKPWLTVVGVAPDLHMDGIANRFPAGMYLPLAQASRRFMGIAARTAADPLAVTEAVRQTMRRLDRSLPVYFVQSLEDGLADEKFFYHLIATIFSILGAAALVLAAVGLYGVLAFSVSRRTAEVGVRMALGAAARDVLRLVVGQGLRQVAVGLVLGLALAAGVAHLMESQLFGIEALDPTTFVVTGALLVAVGIVASLVPALRATRVSPVSALRYE